jgi:hypothetical protein
MFGYVQPNKAELKMREYAQYQAWYCGLCKTLSRSYGQIPRLVLDYYCTFLALLLSGVQGGAEPCSLEKCGYKPFKKKAPVAPPCAALSYAADLNVLLYWHKLLDDWRDERKIAALAGHTSLKAAADLAVKRQPAAANAIAEGIATLSKMEMQREPSIDKAADAFACMLQQLACGYPPLTDGQRETLSWLGYHLGRWIYFMDAWEDRADNEKSNAYNPFLISDAQKDRASFLLYASLNEMEKAYDLLDIQANRGLLDNILYQGCRLRTRQILEGVKE